MIPELPALAIAGLLQALQFTLFATPANIELTPACTTSPRSWPLQVFSWQSLPGGAFPMIQRNSTFPKPVLSCHQPPLPLTRAARKGDSHGH